MKIAYPEQPSGVIRGSLSPTATLLTAGGDARIILDESGLNAYGCQPRPDPNLLAYSSSTASVISASGYDNAERLRLRLVDAVRIASPATVYAREMERIRSELRCLYELSESTDVIFSPSGTDAHTIAAQYAGSGETMPVRVVMIETNETGRGVAAALDGTRLTEHCGGIAPELVPVSVRLADGDVRPPADIDADVESAVSEAAQAGRRVLLILIDQSKTGLLAPSLACVLRHRFNDKIDILVDACQFRIAPPTLRAYLEQGFMVALTGSKFLTGPSFSAALLMSRQTAQKLSARPFPSALEAATSRAHWPSNWILPNMLPHIANFGLLLRWDVALQELQAFCGVDQAAIIRFLQEFASVIQQRLNTDPLFEPLSTPRLDRHPLISANNWDHLQTIFPFVLYHADAGRRRLSEEETRHIYRLLPVEFSETPIAAIRCRLGQPVVCGRRDGLVTSALRLCLDIRHLVKAAVSNDHGVGVIADALAVLDKTAWLIRAIKQFPQTQY